MSTTNDTPRTDEVTQTVFTDAGTINAVPQSFARQLERENAELEKGRATFRRSLWDLVEDLKFCTWQATTDGEKFAFESSAEKLRAILNEGSK